MSTSKLNGKLVTLEDRKGCEPEEHFLMRCATVAEKENRVIIVYGGETCPQ
jgi:hypothetical protein